MIGHKKTNHYTLLHITFFAQHPRAWKPQQEPSIHEKLSQTSIFSLLLVWKCVLPLGDLNSRYLGNEVGCLLKIRNECNWINKD